MDEEGVQAQVPDYTFDIDSLPLDATIADLYQDGSWLVGRTNKGVNFRQRVPVRKMLNKNEKGEWILQDLREVV